MKKDQRRSPSIALVLGIIPGIGQIYAGQFGRGIGVLIFVPAMIVLTLWRMTLGGVGFSGPAVQAPSDAQLRAAWGLGIILFILIGLVYAWSIWDAVSSAQGRPLRIRRILLLGTLALFIVGWDTVQIDFNKAITRLPLLIKALTPIVWPWQDAVTQEVSVTEASSPVDVPCGSTKPTPPAEESGKPFIRVNVTCGDQLGPVQLDGSRTPGTVLHIEGHGFRTNELVTAWWEPYSGDPFRPFIGQYITVNADANGAFTLDMPIPQFPIDGGPNPNSPTHNKLTMRQERPAGVYRISDDFENALSRITETIFIGLMATLFGLVFAIPLSFLAARNIMFGNPVTRAIYFLVRFLFNTVRSIEPLILALVFSIWVGLGPFAGTLALAVHTIASLGKLYSESIESIEDGPLEAIRATGANWLQVIIYGVMPQIIPPFISFTLYRWDLNIRSSTVLGFVGGGGIGFILLEFLRNGNYEGAGLCVWLIGIVVSVIDYASGEVRERFI